MVVVDGKREASQPQPDLDSAATEQWPRRDFPIRGPGKRHAIQVVVRRSVLNEIHEHGLTDTTIEICGVLIGQCYHDERGPFVYIEDIIRGEQSAGQAAQVTFTAETWNHIQNEFDRRHADQRILGWYHTHPGFGIFLSDMDLFIHQNFFSANEQLALVYDPISGEQGLFIWRNGEATQDAFLVDEDTDEVQVEKSHSDSSAAERPAATAGAGASKTDVAERIERLEKRQNTTIAALVIIALLALVWPVAIDQMKTHGLLPGKEEDEAKTKQPELPPPRPQRPPVIIFEPQSPPVVRDKSEPTVDAETKAPESSNGDKPDTSSDAETTPADPAKNDATE